MRAARQYPSQYLREDSRSPVEQKTSTCRNFVRVDDRIRTGDRLDHNQELYLLSYVHRAPPI